MKQEEMIEQEQKTELMRVMLEFYDIYFGLIEGKYNIKINFED